MLLIGIPKGENFLPKAKRLFSDANMLMLAGGLKLQRIQFSGGNEEISQGWLLRSRRVPLLVHRWDLDIGIAGEDIVAESHCSDIVSLLPLCYMPAGLRITRVVVFCQKDDPAKTLEDIPQGARILSEYPRLTRKVLGKGVRIESTLGGAEAEVPRMFRFGVAVCDTGQTLAENGLKEIGTIFASRPVLIANKNTLRYKGPATERLVEKLKKVVSA